MTFLVDAAAFDGSTYLIRGASLGMTAGRQFLASGWVKTTKGTTQTLLRNTNGTVFITIDFGQLNFTLSSAGGAATLIATSALATLTDGLWHHFAFSANTNFAAGAKLVKLMIDGVADAFSMVQDLDAAFDIELDDTDWAIGTRPSSPGTRTFQGDMAEFYVTNSYLDVSVPANLAKFYNSGVPVDLGATGNLPTGTAAVVYETLGDGETPASKFAINKGTGGGWTLTGTLTTSATSPSDNQPVIPPGPNVMLGGGAKESPEFQEYLSRRRQLMLDTQVRAEHEVERRIKPSMLAAIAEIQRREQIEESDRRRIERDRYERLADIQSGIEVMRAEAYKTSPEGILETVRKTEDMEINRRWNWPTVRKDRAALVLRHLTFLNVGGRIGQLSIRGHGPTAAQLQSLMDAKMQLRFPSMGNRSKEDNERMVREITALIELADRAWYESVMT